jgi:DNA repair photolyase
MRSLRNPVAIVTKSRLVARDRDVLAELAEHGASRVLVSVTTLDAELARRLEPRAAQPSARLAAIEALACAGVPVGVLIAPVIPALNDHEIPAILKAAQAAGASSAGFVMLRLPHGVKDLFEQWLAEHVPHRRERVLARIREVRGGALNDPRFGSRMRGEGLLADQIGKLFSISAHRTGLDRPVPPLCTTAFRRPGTLPLFP